MNKSMLFVFLILVTASVFSSPQPIQDIAPPIDSDTPEIYPVAYTETYETTCEFLILKSVPKYKAGMSIDEMAAANAKGISLITVNKPTCDYLKRENELLLSMQHNKSASPVIHLQTITPPPTPPSQHPPGGGTWKVYASYQHQTKDSSTCMIIDSSEYIWRAVYFDENGQVQVSYTSTSQITAIYPDLNCQSTSIGNN